MNLRTTLALLVLAAAGGVVLWVGASLPAPLNPAAPPPSTADAGSREFLEHIDPAALTRIEIDSGDRPPVVLQQAAGAWTMPGNWPVNAAVVKELTDFLGRLRPRFEPQAVDADHPLASFGLDRPAVVVKLETADAKHKLSFGRKPGIEANPFTQETFVRLDDKPEFLRLGPGLIDELSRPVDYYQQRRLFPGERTAKSETDKEKVERLAAKGVAVEDKKEGGSKFAITHGADGWELSSPTRDRLEARTRDALLSAVPDLWAERFVETDVPAAGAAPAAIDGSLPGLLSALFWANVNTSGKAPQWLLTRAGLDAPERTVSVTGDDGRTITLVIGKSAGVRTSHVMRPPPPGIPSPPMDTEESEEFLYAKLKDNAQVFEIKADKLKDVFASLGSLRDPQLAHFSSGDATRLEISQGGQEIVIIKDKDKDRWNLDKPLHADADRQKVTDLLNRLSGLEARDKDVIDGADVKTTGLDQTAAVIKVTVEEKIKEAEEAKAKGKTKTRVLTFKLGKHDDADKKVYVQADDWPRVNKVADGGSPGDVGLSGLVKREAREYRGKRLFDFATGDLATVTVQRGADPQFVLQKIDSGWRLTASAAPADADSLATSSLANALANLEVIEYVNDAPKVEELEPQYGLGKPALTVHIEYTDKNKAAQILHVGKKRDGKPGRFGQITAAGAEATPSAVFALPDDSFTTLDQDSLAYLPKRLWDVAEEDVTALRIHRNDQPEYTLTKAGMGWKIGGPFDADALAPAGLLTSARSPQVESYKAFEAKNPAEFGLDAPYLTVAVKAKDGTEHTLTVGGPTAKDATTRYAQADKKPAVFVLPTPLVASLDKPALDLLDPVLFRLGSNHLDHVQIQTKDETLKLALQPKGWQVVEGPGAPFAADLDAAARLQNLWFTLKATRFAAYGPNVKWEDFDLAAPASVVTVGVKKDDAAPVGQHTVKLGKVVEGGGQYARFDDQPGAAVLDAATVKELSHNHLDFVDRGVFTFDAGAVTALSLHRPTGAGDVDLKKQDDAWKMVKPTAETADEKSLQSLLAQLSKLRADRVAEYPAKNLEMFGLATPEVTAIVQLGAAADAPKHVLLIGKAVVAGPVVPGSPDPGTAGDRFAMAQGGQSVVVIPAALARRLTSGALAFRDRSMIKVASDPDRVRLERDPRKATFSKVEGSWKMTEPLKADLDQDALDDFLNSLLTLRADELVAEKPTPDALKSYGLDNPEAKWRLQNGDKDVLTLLVGKKEKDGPRAYAQLAGRDLVFLLDPPLTGRALGEFRTRTVWTTSLDAIGVIGLEYKKAGGGGFELAKGDDGWKAVGKPDAKVEAKTVEETLAALAGLKLERYVVDKDANLSLFGLAPEPEWTIEARTKTGQHFTLQLGRPEGDSKRRYAHVPEPGRTDVFVIGEADAEKIVRDLAAFGKPPATPAVPTAPITP
jgi:hypothetical protein